MAKKLEGAGLRGIVAGNTVLSTVGKDGHGLTYRGYPIEVLVAKASWEEVAYMVLKGNLPTQAEFSEFGQSLASKRGIDGKVANVLEQIPSTAHPMNVIASGVSILGTLNSEHEDMSNTWDCTLDIIAKLPSMLLYWYHFAHSGKRIDTDTNIESTAEHFLTLLHHGEAVVPMHKKCLDNSLTLYTEHEFNASTFTGRIIASTLSDIYSSIAGAIGALRGPLHGGANEKALELIKRIGTADKTEDTLNAMIAKGEKIMGFGHAIYSDHDPRSAPIKAWAQRLSTESGDTEVFEISKAVEKYMWDTKKLFPNADFYHASAYESLHIPVPLFTPIFAMGRAAGWIAHIVEQRSDNRIIRPIADYVGNTSYEWVDIADR